MWNNLSACKNQRENECKLQKVSLIFILLLLRVWKTVWKIGFEGRERGTGWRKRERGLAGIRKSNAIKHEMLSDSLLMQTSLSCSDPFSPFCHLFMHCTAFPSPRLIYDFAFSLLHLWLLVSLLSHFWCLPKTSPSSLTLPIYEHLSPFPWELIPECFLYECTNNLSDLMIAEVVSIKE